MIKMLIIDTGSTKAEWHWINSDGQLEMQNITSGISPYYQTTAQIVAMLEQEIPATARPFLPNKIYFYGTGCSTAESCAIVQEALQQVWQKATIQVAHDLLSAARALAYDKPALIAIAGTGSNACFYDGEKIAWNAPNLGFWLGDEGSGGYLGKNLWIDALHKSLPNSLAQKLEIAYPHLNRDVIIAQAYQKPFPNRFFAQFATFIGNNLAEEPYCKDLVARSFGLFFDKYVCVFPQFREYPLHSIGSVAYHFQEIYKEVAHQKNIIIGNFERTPIGNLTLYHIKKEGKLA